MRRVLVAAAAAWLLLAGPAAAAPPTTIDFSGLAQFESVRDQYASQGVRFGSSSSFGITPPQAFDCAGGQAFSPGIAGTSNQIACASGPSEFPDRRFATTIKFDTERRRVQFNLQQRIRADVTATIRVLGVGRNVLSTQTRTLSRDSTVPIDLQRGSSDIAYVQVYGLLDYYDNGNVLLDDLVAQLDDVPPPPKWSLAVQTPALDAVEGTQVIAKVGVERFNGSSGPVTLSVPGLPQGIVATQFATNPVSGTAPSDLRITAGTPLSGEREITVNASAGGAAGTGVITTGTVRVTGRPAITIAEGGRFTRTVAAGCGPQAFRESFQVRGGYGGDVRLTPTGASATPGQLTATGDGDYPYTLNVSPGPVGSVQTVTLRADPVSATPAALDVAFRTVALNLRGTFPTDKPIGWFGDKGIITLRGTFPDSCPLTFVDPLGQTLSATKTVGDGPNGSTEDVYRVQLPDNAVPGPIRMIGPSGEIGQTAPVDVYEYRNSVALRAPNSGATGGAPDYTWQEFVNTFGANDAFRCGLFGCVADPRAVQYWSDFRREVQRFAGLCAGYTMLAMRFRGAEGGLNPATYLAGARRAWQIENFADGQRIKTDIVRHFVSQNDAQFGQRRAAAMTVSAADKRAEARRVVGLGGAYLRLRQRDALGNWMGHAVVVTDVQETTTPTGPGMILAVADSNQPYTFTELTSLSVRNAARTGSVVTVQGDGSWSGPASLNWSGVNDTLGIIRAIPDNDPDLTGAGSVFGVSLDGTGPGAAVTGIRSDGRPALTDAGEGRAGSGVTVDPSDSGVSAVPRWRLATGREYAVTVRGGSDGAITPFVRGDGVTARVTTDGAAGRSDVVRFTPGQAQVGLDPGGRAGTATYELTEQAGGGTRAATVGMRGDGEVALGDGAVRIRNAGGATTATVTLTSVGRGLPSSVTTRGLRVGAGQRVDLTPRSWTDVERGVRLVVRDRRGRVVRRGRAALRRTRAVSLSGVRAARKGSTITVTGRVGKRGRQPLLLAAIGKRGASLRQGDVKAGRFRLRITRAPRRGRVTVKLIDEAAGFASVTKRVRAR